MLFNSLGFILVFLPLCLAGVWLASRFAGPRVTLYSLIVFSLLFYCWWNPPQVFILLGSILLNHLISGGIYRLRMAKKQDSARLLLIIGIVGNLAVLGYFKYINFIAENVSFFTGTQLALHQIVLPLGISFFTFEQITYLVDVYRRDAERHSLRDFGLFVTFFPHLIAGPILYHYEFIPQLKTGRAFAFRADDLAVGATIFTLGLLKKVFIADSVAVYATPAFRAADAGVALSCIEAWGGALAYTLQLYFDFSGYSDMAIGLALLFGLKLPINFDSPYKSQSIIDFWRRWHMTLSRFLRDYLYIPLGGNRSGTSRRWINLMITMLLGGLWHGAAWTFVIWGGLHGIYLCVNHAWRSLRSWLVADRPAGRWERGLAWFATFMAVVVAWVFFRAETLQGALSMLDGMVGGNGFVLPEQWQRRFGFVAPLLGEAGLHFGPTPFFSGTWQFAITLGALLIALLAPNTQQIVAWQYGSGASTLFGRRGPIAAIIFGLAGAGALIRILTSGYSEFLYFQF